MDYASDFRCLSIFSTKGTMHLWQLPIGKVSNF